MRHTGTQTIATERLTLRRFTIEDAENMYYNWASDPEVTRYLTWQPHKSVEETAEILQQWEAGYSKNEFYQWAIELNDIEQPIGSISVVSLNEDVQSAELGYCIGKSWWHQGYTTEAVETVIRFLMAEVGAGRVWSQHDVANPNSGEVMKKAGMDYEGTLRQSLKDNQGIVDSAVYAKISHVALDEEPEEEDQTSGTMKNVISDDTMEYVGILAKLELSPEEAEAAKKDMEDMLDYIDLLNELDTTGIEPMSHVFPIENVFREDVVTNGDGSADTLKNAPEQKDGGFKVPKTIGE